MKPNPQRYIDLNHSGSNGAKAPPQSPNGYPGAEAPSWSLLGSGAEAFLGANPAPLPKADLAHLGAETALGLICLLLEQRIFLVLQGRRFFSGAPLASLRNEIIHLGAILASWSGGSLKAPLAPLGAVSSKPLWLLLERRLLLELFWLLWS